MEKRHTWLSLFSLSRLGKKGLSEIITTLIIILVSLVAIFAVWIVVRNVIEKGSQEISFDKFSISLEIQKVVINSGSLDVTVKRNVGAGTIKSLKFVVYDGSSSQTLTINDPGLDELGVKVFPLSYDGLAKEVSVVPVFDSGSMGNPVIKKYTDAEMFKSLGLISWWRFEDNLVDSAGGNNGAEQGVGLSYQSGKFGKALNLAPSISNPYVSVPDNPSLDPVNGITIAAWEFRPASVAYSPIIGKTITFGNPVSDGYELIYALNDIHFRTANGDVSYNGVATGTWNHIVGTYSSSSGRIVLYVNGVVLGNQSAVGLIPDSSNNFWIGRANRGSSYFTGKIDEVMIFDRALSPGQISGLKNYTFS